MKKFFLSKEILIKIRNNILYIFGLCLIISYSIFYVFSNTNLKYGFDLDLSIKDAFNKEITYIHLTKAIYKNIIVTEDVVPSLRLNNLFDEFGYSVKNEIERKVGCLTFLKHQNKNSFERALNSIKIFCRTTNKSEKFLYDEIIKIYKKNENFYTYKYNQIIDVFLLSFVSSGGDDVKKKSWDVFHIKNLADYNLKIYKIENKKGLLINSILFSMTISLLIYLSLNLILNLYYKK